MSKRELIIIGAGLLIFIAVLTFVFCSADSRQTSASPGAGFDTRAETEEERIGFLEQFGWKVDSEPISVREIRLSGEMDERMLEYNRIQLRQGFDLAPLCGKRIKLWTYSVTNYPAGGNVVANLIVFDGRVVGGDISSVRSEGFCHGFDPTVFAAETAEVQAKASLVDRTVPDRIPTDEDVPPENDGD